MVSYDAGTEQAGVLGSLLHWVTSFAWAHQRKLLSVFFLSVLLEKAEDSAIHPGSISSWEMLGEGDAGGGRCCNGFAQNSRISSCTSVAEKAGSQLFGHCRSELGDPCETASVLPPLRHTSLPPVSHSCDPPMPTFILSSPQVSWNLTSWTT